MGAEKKGLDLYGDVVFLPQSVDPLQADVAPWSNVVVPDNDSCRGVATWGSGFRAGHVHFLVRANGALPSGALGAIIPAGLQGVNI